MVLYIVCTPIGNLADISQRALSVIGGVDIIVCEDTRVSVKLLKHFNISKPLISYHHHSSERDIKKILQYLQAGKSLAYLSDAGTPGISDPGNKLVKAVRDFFPQARIIPIPGPSALTTALSVSGFPTDKFYFKGFIPHKKGRNKFLNTFLDNKETIIFFESVHRISKLLEELDKIIPERQIFVARELTKKFESCYNGFPSQVANLLQADKVKGEFVVIISPV